MDPVLPTSLGYDVADNVVCQDNKSAILLEKNGRASTGKRSGHINVRYFFVTDRIEKNELTVEHCPTKEMTGDYFTKPLQGESFYKMRNRIMNITNDNDVQLLDDNGIQKKSYNPIDDSRLLPNASESQECVGD